MNNFARKFTIADTETDWKKTVFSLLWILLLATSNDIILRIISVVDIGLNFVLWLRDSRMDWRTKNTFSNNHRHKQSCTSLIYAAMTKCKHTYSLIILTSQMALTHGALHKKWGHKPQKNRSFSQPFSNEKKKKWYFIGFHPQN